jgi:hypothetical protein
VNRMVRCLVRARFSLPWVMGPAGSENGDWAERG